MPRRRPRRSAKRSSNAGRLLGQLNIFPLSQAVIFPIGNSHRLILLIAFTHDVDLQLVVGFERAVKGAMMHKTQLALIGLCGDTSLGLSPLGVQAAPAAPGMTQTIAAVGAQSKPQDVAYRRCWWQQGHRHCRWYDAPYRGYGYYPYRGDG